MSPEVMQDIRASIVIRIDDDGPQTLEALLGTFQSSGYPTNREWVQEALHQLFWTEVVTRKGGVYLPGPDFYRYLWENVRGQNSGQDQKVTRSSRE